MRTDDMAPELTLTPGARQRWMRLRQRKDRFATLFILLGGAGVILSVLLLLGYLLLQVIPLAQPAKLLPGNGSQAYILPDSRDTRWLALDEEGEVGVRLNAQGELLFFAAASGTALGRQPLPLPPGRRVRQVVSAEQGWMAIELDNGALQVTQRRYLPNPQPDDNDNPATPSLTPQLTALFDGAVLPLPTTPAAQLALAASDSQLLLARADATQLQLLEIPLDTDQAPSNALPTARTLPSPGFVPRKLLLMPALDQLLLLGPDNRFAVVSLSQPTQVQQFEPALGPITLFELLPERRQLIIGDSNGQLQLWFQPSSAGGRLPLQEIHAFAPLESAPQQLQAQGRDGSFFVLGSNGELRLFSSNDRAALLATRLAPDTTQLALADNGNRLLVQQADTLSLWLLQAPYKTLTWNALWNQIWYEGYEQPGYIWQPAAAGGSSAPKYSLTPLIFGTLKAALCAMLIATPLAISAALYSAYFMNPGLRRKVKPLVELMAAIPTVILGLLASLWLAPLLLNHLAAILLATLLIPGGIVLLALGCQHLPGKLRCGLPQGYELLLLLLLIPLLATLAGWIAPALEIQLFDANLVHWLSEHVGIPYEQRNALVVGIALGFAIIPTLFALTEEAIQAVPRQLSDGALALGATPWQAMTRLILPAASAGIVSALMISLGRAFGEAMIVLMVTGNTPIMEVNLFEGLRSLAASIATEVPESEVGSSHYRILFLAALLLFLFTLAINTLAELIRQRLRRRYSAL